MADFTNGIRRKKSVLDKISQITKSFYLIMILNDGCHPLIKIMISLFSLEIIYFHEKINVIDFLLSTITISDSIFKRSNLFPFGRLRSFFF